MKTIIITLVVSLISYSGLKAQKLWTLTECIEYSKNNNLALKQQELGVKTGEASLRQSYAEILPGINATANHSYNYGRTVDRFTNQFASTRVQSDNFYLSGNFTVFNGFQQVNSIKKGKTDLQAAKMDVDNYINELSQNIALAYLNILYNIEMLDIANKQTAASKLQTERLKKLYDAGTKAKGDLLNMEAQLAADELQQVNAANNLDMSYLTLKQLLDLPAEEQFDIVKPQVEIDSGILINLNPTEVFNYALTNQPSVKSAELKLKSSDLSLSIARGTISPTINLQGNIGTGYSGASQRIKGYETQQYVLGYTSEIPSIPVVSTYNNPLYENIPFDDQVNDNINKSIGLSLIIPLFNNLQSRTAISKAKISVKNSEYVLQNEKNKLLKDIQQAHLDAKAALNKYNATNKNLSAFTEAFKYSEERFNAGLINFVDYNDAKIRLEKAQAEMMQAKYDCIFKIKLLEFYFGKPIGKL
ncbi:MAG: TolC family protein [Bacteroidales bacterium]|nr:TolC family protein [Bacteroidales bacterium]